MKKIEFSKILLLMDYLLMVVLIFLTIKFPEAGLTSVDCAWIAQLGISSGAYYWKTKNENRTKVPFKVIQSLPPKMRNQVDLTSVITSIIQSE